MSAIDVLKFGSSVLRSPDHLPVAVDEIYRRWRGGSRVLAVVSAFEGVTNQLLREAESFLGAANQAGASAAVAASAIYVATGELRAAALLTGVLENSGIPARMVEPREIGLVAEGGFAESMPRQVNVEALLQFWTAYPVLVLPGFYGADGQGRTVLFGRGGSDLSALFLAGALKTHGLSSHCRLVKDVMGVYDTDPASTRSAHRFSSLTWTKAEEVAGPLIQPKALHYALAEGLRFEVGRPNEGSCTVVGAERDEWAPPDRVGGGGQRVRSQSRLGIALVGCGSVGRGVYERVKRYGAAFELRHVVVREVENYPGVEQVTADGSVVLGPEVDVVIVCTPASAGACSLIATALEAGKFVITANKAAIAECGSVLGKYARGESRRLWYSAAVGGALPALETLRSLVSPVREIRGIVNGTCGVVLEHWAAGKTRSQAVAIAQEAGFAEADPTRDLSGRDSMDKLVLMAHAAFGEWMTSESTVTLGLDTIVGDPQGYHLIARATRTPQGIKASVGPEMLRPGCFLAGSKGAENRVEIELETGEVIRLRGQGAGRWPTTVSVMGDLHEIARVIHEAPTECESIDS
jgi:homoserine dehydrogenase